MGCDVVFIARGHVSGAGPASYRQARGDVEWKPPRPWSLSLSLLLLLLLPTGQLGQWCWQHTMCTRICVFCLATLMVKGIDALAITAP
jgi:hypothetical protein